MGQEQGKGSHRVPVTIAIVAIAAATLAVGLLPWILPRSIFGDVNCTLKCRLEMLGTYGDMFGMLNATVSGLAFVAFFYTLRVQQKQHDLQHQEVEMMKSRASLCLNVDRTRRIFKDEVAGAKSADKKDLFPAAYVRIVVENQASTVAKGCQAMLVGIHEKTKDGEWVEVEEYQDSLRLRRSQEDSGYAAFRGFDIPYGIFMSFNVFSMKDETRKGGGKYTLLQVAPDTAKYRKMNNILKFRHTYKFIISVVSQNAYCLGVELVVNIGDDLDGIGVETVNSEERKGLLVTA